MSAAAEDLLAKASNHDLFTKILQHLSPSEAVEYFATKKINVIFTLEPGETVEGILEEAFANIVSPDRRSEVEGLVNEMLKAEDETAPARALLEYAVKLRAEQKRLGGLEQLSDEEEELKFQLGNLFETYVDMRNEPKYAAYVPAEDKDDLTPVHYHICTRLSSAITAAAQKCGIYDPANDAEVLKRVRAAVVLDVQLDQFKTYEKHIRETLNVNIVEPARARVSVLQLTPSQIFKRQHSLKRQRVVDLRAASLVDVTSYKLPVYTINVGTNLFSGHDGPFSFWRLATVTAVEESEAGRLVHIVYAETGVVRKRKASGLAALQSLQMEGIMLPVGARVVAHCNLGQMEEGDIKLMAGTVLEPPVEENKFRYLVCFDLSRVQYLECSLVHRVVEQNHEPWELLRKLPVALFLKDYISEWPERHQANVSTGQLVPCRTVDGDLTKAKVLERDCSVAQLEFGTDQPTEWLYLGNVRFEVLNKFINDAKGSAGRGMAHRSKQGSSGESISVVNWSAPREARRHTARKTLRGENALRDRAPPALPTPEEKIGVMQPVHQTVDIETNEAPLSDGHQTCSPACLRLPCGSSDDPTPHRSAVNPLNIPYHFGWKRYIVKSNMSVSCVYCAPCGKLLRNTREIKEYLTVTDSSLPTFLFCVEQEVRCNTEWTADQRLVRWRNPDISAGKEPCKIPAVNCYGEDQVPDFEYRAEVIEVPPMKITRDKDFTIFCKCGDVCRDKKTVTTYNAITDSTTRNRTCQCHIVTRQASAVNESRSERPHCGYKDQRLPNGDQQEHGIYECNQYCQCALKTATKLRCATRVVGNGSWCRVQVFRKQNNVGWGVRAVDDIPEGQYIAHYAGELISDAEANTRQEDTYFVELDYIEVALREKMGDRPAKKAREEADMTRKYIDADALEAPVVDARRRGNWTRFMNHSCNPNVTAQNVFVDSQDIRFPWVCFFSSRRIRAGEELCWNYGYEIHKNGFNGKKEKCLCGTKFCTGRLK